LTAVTANPNPSGFHARAGQNQRDLFPPQAIFQSGSSKSVKFPSNCSSPRRSGNCLLHSHLSAVLGKKETTGRSGAQRTSSGSQVPARPGLLSSADSLLTSQPQLTRLSQTQKRPVPPSPPPLQFQRQRAVPNPAAAWCGASQSLLALLCRSRWPCPATTPQRPVCRLLSPSAPPRPRTRPG